MDILIGNPQMHAWDVLQHSVFRAHTASSPGKVTPTAAKKWEPSKCSDSWNVTEMLHLKDKGFLPSGTPHLCHGQKILSSQYAPSCIDFSISWCSVPCYTVLTFRREIKTRLTNTPNGPVKLITLGGLEIQQQQEPAPAPEPLQKSRIQEMEKPLSFPEPGQ